MLLLASVLLGMLALGLVGLRFGFATSGAPACGCTAVAGIRPPLDGWRWVGLGIAAGSSAVLALAALWTARSVRRAAAAVRQSRLGRRTIAGVRATVVPGTEPRAFCVGGWRPMVAVTAGVLGLSVEEQRAVLAHERAHAAARDPLVFAFLDTLGRILPPLAPLADEYRRLAEFAADDSARAASGDAAFAAVLMKAVEPAPRGAAGFSPTEARIQRFLGNEHGSSRRRFAAPLLGFGVALVLLAVAMVGSHRAAAHEAESMCRIEARLCAGPAPAPVVPVCISTLSGTVCLR